MSSVYTHGFLKLSDGSLCQSLQLVLLSTYRRQFEHDGLALLHFRFPRLQKMHVFIVRLKEGRSWLMPIQRGPSNKAPKITCAGLRCFYSGHGSTLVRTLN